MESKDFQNSRKTEPKVRENLGDLGDVITVMGDSGLTDVQDHHLPGLPAQPHGAQHPTKGLGGVVGVPGEKEEGMGAFTLENSEVSIPFIQVVIIKCLDKVTERYQ